MSDSGSLTRQNSYCSSEFDLDSNDLNVSSLNQISILSPPLLHAPNLQPNSFTSHINPLDLKSMAESTKHCEIGETNKLLGLQNYNVWKIKMEAIFRREKLWGLIETKRSDSVFPTQIEGITYTTEERF